MSIWDEEDENNSELLTELERSAIWSDKGYADYSSLKDAIYQHADLARNIKNDQWWEGLRSGKNMPPFELRLDDIRALKKKWPKIKKDSSEFILKLLAVRQKNEKDINDVFSMHMRDHFDEIEFFFLMIYFNYVLSSFDSACEYSTLQQNTPRLLDLFLERYTNDQKSAFKHLNAQHIEETFILFANDFVGFTIAEFGQETDLGDSSAEVSKSNKDDDDGAAGFSMKKGRD